jgi:hypothetical protein
VNPRARKARQKKKIMSVSRKVPLPKQTNNMARADQVESMRVHKIDSVRLR